jgi:hypothetical protein
MTSFTILAGLPLLIHTVLSFYEGVGIGAGDLKIEESESEVLCTNSTALFISIHYFAHIRYEYASSTAVQRKIHKQNGND